MLHYLHCISSLVFTRHLKPVLFGWPIKQTLFCPPLLRPFLLSFFISSFLGRAEASFACFPTSQIATAHTTTRRKGLRNPDSAQPHISHPLSTTSRIPTGLRSTRTWAWKCGMYESGSGCIGAPPLWEVSEGAGAEEALTLFPFFLSLTHSLLHCIAWIRDSHSPRSNSESLDLEGSSAKET
jgi:hypothetical protein